MDGTYIGLLVVGMVSPLLRLVLSREGGPGLRASIAQYGYSPDDRLAYSVAAMTCICRIPVANTHAHVHVCVKIPCTISLPVSLHTGPVGYMSVGWPARIPG